MIGMKLAIVGIPAQLLWVECAFYPAIPHGVSLSLKYSLDWLFPTIEVVSMKRDRFFEPKVVFRFTDEYRNYDKSRHEYRKNR